MAYAMPELGDVSMVVRSEVPFFDSATLREKRGLPIGLLLSRSIESMQPFVVMVEVLIMYSSFVFRTLSVFCTLLVDLIS